MARKAGYGKRLHTERLYEGIQLHKLFVENRVTQKFWLDYP